MKEGIKFGVNWNNAMRHAKNPKDSKGQAAINARLMNYIRILQEQITELKEILDDDGK